MAEFALSEIRSLKKEIEALKAENEDFKKKLDSIKELYDKGFLADSWTMADDYTITLGVPVEDEEWDDTSDDTSDDEEEVGDEAQRSQRLDEILEKEFMVELLGSEKLKKIEKEMEEVEDYWNWKKEVGE